MHMVSQGTARPPRGEASCVRTVLILVCILALIEVAAGRAPAGSGNATAQVSTAVDSAMRSSFRRKLVQENVSLF